MSAGKPATWEIDEKDIKAEDLWNPNDDQNVDFDPSQTNNDADTSALGPLADPDQSFLQETDTKQSTFDSKPNPNVLPQFYSTEPRPIPLLMDQSPLPLFFTTKQRLMIHRYATMESLDQLSNSIQHIKQLELRRVHNVGGGMRPIIWSSRLLDQLDQNKDDPRTSLDTVRFWLSGSEAWWCVCDLFAALTSSVSFLTVASSKFEATLKIIKTPSAKSPPPISKLRGLQLVNIPYADSSASASTDPTYGFGTSGDYTELKHIGTRCPNLQYLSVVHFPSPQVNIKRRDVKFDVLFQTFKKLSTFATGPLSPQELKDLLACEQLPKTLQVFLNLEEWKADDMVDALSSFATTTTETIVIINMSAVHIMRLLNTSGKKVLSKSTAKPLALFTSVKVVVRDDITQAWTKELNVKSREILKPVAEHTFRHVEFVYADLPQVDKPMQLLDFLDQNWNPVTFPPPPPPPTKPPVFYDAATPTYGKFETKWSTTLLSNPPQIDSTFAHRLYAMTGNHMINYSKIEALRSTATTALLLTSNPKKSTPLFMPTGIQDVRIVPYQLASPSHEFLAYPRKGDVWYEFTDANPLAKFVLYVCFKTEAVRKEIGFSFNNQDFVVKVFGDQKSQTSLYKLEIASPILVKYPVKIKLTENEDAFFLVQRTSTLFDGHTSFAFPFKDTKAYGKSQKLSVLSLKDKDKVVIADPTLVSKIRPGLEGCLTLEGLHEQIKPGDIREGRYLAFEKLRKFVYEKFDVSGTVTSYLQNSIPVKVNDVAISQDEISLFIEIIKFRQEALLGTQRKLLLAIYGQNTPYATKKGYEFDMQSGENWLGYVLMMARSELEIRRANQQKQIQTAMARKKPVTVQNTPFTAATWEAALASVQQQRKQVAHEVVAETPKPKRLRKASSTIPKPSA